MILKKEIEQLAEQQGVAKSAIDKDWVLGHFIDAIFSTDECREHLTFKGGTCLRKCYFPYYRFSEDLDFTVTDGDFILDKKLLTKIASLVTERTGIPLYIHEIKPMQHRNYEVVKNELFLLLVDIQSIKLTNGWHYGVASFASKQVKRSSPQKTGRVLYCAP